MKLEFPIIAEIPQAEHQIIGDFREVKAEIHLHKSSGIPLKTG